MVNLLPFTYFVESAWRSDVRQTSTLHMLLNYFGSGASLLKRSHRSTDRAEAV